MFAPPKFGLGEQVCVEVCEQLLLVGALPALADELEHRRVLPLKLFEHLLREGSLVVRHELSDGLGSLVVIIQVEVPVTPYTDGDGALGTGGVGHVVLKFQHHPTRDKVVTGDIPVALPAEGRADTTVGLLASFLASLPTPLDYIERDSARLQYLTEPEQDLALRQPFVKYGVDGRILSRSEPRKLLGGSLLTVLVLVEPDRFAVDVDGSCSGHVHPLCVGKGTPYGI
jgi:hypothetical protein